MTQDPVQKELNGREPRGLIGLVFLLFFLSGAFVLVYEVAWTRALTLEFGATSLAVATVLSVFMAGLAIGAHFAGRQADRLEKPLFTYGIIEISIALYALASPWIFSWVLPLFSLAGARMVDSFLFITLLRFVICTILLLPPAILMGATLPILSRFYVMRKPDPERGVGLLYGVNTVGAFLGVLGASFLLLPYLGLKTTIIAIAADNLVLGLLACLCSKVAEEPAKREANQSSQLDVVTDSPSRLILWAAALTGGASMVCEVAWTRVLILVLGASVYAFSVVLFTFLLGLGLGAWSVAYFLRVSPARARTVFLLLALAAGISVCVSSATFLHLPSLFIEFHRTLNLSVQAGNIFWSQLIIAGCVMFIPTFIMGGLFSAAVKAIIPNRGRVGRTVAKLYTFNTVGAIVGSASAGFFLIPVIGIRHTLVLAAAVQCVAGLLAYQSKQRASRLPGGLAVAGLIVALFMGTPAWEKHLMTSGAFSYAELYEHANTDSLRAKLAKEKELLFYRDGLTATVTVARSLKENGQPLFIGTNGKTDGSSHGDMPTQKLLAHIPMLLHPAPQEICVVGMGTGSTAGSASLYLDANITVVEIEQAMIEGARFFREHNYAVHDNPKVEIRTTDARLLLKLSDSRFDVITSEPSNPWLAGTADLFTKEFYEIGAKALRPDGFFCQWVPIYGLSPDNVQMIVRTFATVFPNTYIACTIPFSDILLVGSKSAFLLDPNRVAERMKQPEIRQDLADARVRITSATELMARIIMGPDEIPLLTGPGDLHTDDKPLLAYRAPKDLYRNHNRVNMALLTMCSRGMGKYVATGSESKEQKDEFMGGWMAAYKVFWPKLQGTGTPDSVGTN